MNFGFPSNNFYKSMPVVKWICVQLLILPNVEAIVVSHLILLHRQQNLGNLGKSLESPIGPPVGQGIL